MMSCISYIRHLIKWNLLLRQKVIDAYKSDGLTWIYACTLLTCGHADFFMYFDVMLIKKMTTCQSNPTQVKTFFFSDTSLFKQKYCENKLWKDDVFIWYRHGYLNMMAHIWLNTKFILFKLNTSGDKEPIGRTGYWLHYI